MLGLFLYFLEKRLEIQDDGSKMAKFWKCDVILGVILRHDWHVTTTKKLVIFKKITTFFDLKDMCRCYEHHHQ